MSGPQQGAGRETKEGDKADLGESAARFLIDGLWPAGLVFWGVRSQHAGAIHHKDAPPVATLQRGNRLAKLVGLAGLEPLQPWQWETGPGGAKGIGGGAAPGLFLAHPPRLDGPLGLAARHPGIKDHGKKRPENQETRQPTLAAAGQIPEFAQKGSREKGTDRRFQIMKVTDPGEALPGRFERGKLPPECRKLRVEDEMFIHITR